MSGSSSHPGDVSELPAGPPITQESVNLAETICSTSDHVLYVTYPPAHRRGARKAVEVRQCGVGLDVQVPPHRRGAGQLVEARGPPLAHETEVAGDALAKGDRVSFQLALDGVEARAGHSNSAGIGGVIVIPGRVIVVPDTSRRDGAALIVTFEAAVLVAVQAVVALAGFVAFDSDIAASKGEEKSHCAAAVG